MSEVIVFVVAVFLFGFGIGLLAGLIVGEYWKRNALECIKKRLELKEKAAGKDLLNCQYLPK